MPVGVDLRVELCRGASVMTIHRYPVITRSLVMSTLFGCGEFLAESRGALRKPLGCLLRGRLFHRKLIRKKCIRNLVDESSRLELVGSCQTDIDDAA